MQELQKLLDKVRKSRSLNSDAALARALGVKPQTMSNWRKGHNLPDAVACARLAELSGEPLARVLGMIGEARAISAAEKAVWRRLAEAAVVLLAVIATGSAPGQADAKTSPQNGPFYTLCTVRRLRNFLDRVRNVRLSARWLQWQPCIP